MFKSIKQVTYSPELLENENMTNETLKSWVEEQKASRDRGVKYSLIVGGMRGVGYETFLHNYPDDVDGLARWETDRSWYNLGVGLVDKLTGHQYEVLVYFFCDQMSVADIAEKLDCTFQNIYKTIKVIRRKLSNDCKI